MGHPEVVNRTPFVTETLFLADGEGIPLCVPIVKATFELGSAGDLSIAEAQIPLNLEGTSSGDPATASYIYEPETAFFKPATDVVLIGHAVATAPGTTELLVGIRVGPVQKLVKVLGDRYLIGRSGELHVSRTAPFERIPLTYERAFGGWDR